MLELLPYVVSWQKLAATPPYLIHFVTKRCNARCPHCFVYDAEGKALVRGPEMSLEQIDRMVRSLGRPLYNVNLTGGETFLRSDLVEICEAYLNHTAVRVIQLFTNGYLQERIIEVMRHLCTEYPRRQFVVAISVDDLHEAHNQYRHLDNGFERALGTYERLREMGLENLGLDVGITVNHSNQGRLDEIYDYLVRHRGVRTLSCSLVRGHPRDPTSLDVDLELYKRFSQRLDQGMLKGELDCFEGFAGADLINAKSLYMRGTAIPAECEHGFRSFCYAGRLIGVVHANGDVFPCEMLDETIGNLADHDYSLPELWSSQSARRITDWIWRSRCHCSHECFQTTNILFNPRYYPAILRAYASIKLARLRTRLRRERG